MRIVSVECEYGFIECQNGCTVRTLFQADLGLSVIAGRKSYTARVTAEEVEELYEGLGCKKLKAVGAFKLANDDPAPTIQISWSFWNKGGICLGSIQLVLMLILTLGFLLWAGKARAAVVGPPPSVTPADAANSRAKSDLVNWHLPDCEVVSEDGDSRCVFQLTSRPGWRTL